MADVIGKLDTMFTPIHRTGSDWVPTLMTYFIAVVDVRRPPDVLYNT